MRPYFSATNSFVIFKLVFKIFASPLFLLFYLNLFYKKLPYRCLYRPLLYFEKMDKLWVTIALNPVNSVEKLRRDTMNCDLVIIEYLIHCEL